MFFYVQRLLTEVPADEPDPAAAAALQEVLGGQVGELRMMLQFLFQAFTARGDAKPYQDLVHGIGTEEIGHVELVAKTITRLLDGSPRHAGTTSRAQSDVATAVATGTLQHHLQTAQAARPYDAAGNPWSGATVHNSGNLVLDLLNNLMLESTGRLQKCRLYEMTENATARATLAYLIVRDQAHENAYARALETLSVDWGRALPIPKTDAERFPEVRRLLELGQDRAEYTFNLDGRSEMAKVFQGQAPASAGGGPLSVEGVAPEGWDWPPARDRPQDHAPGLDRDLLALVQETAEAAMTVTPLAVVPPSPDPGQAPAP